MGSIVCGFLMAACRAGFWQRRLPDPAIPLQAGRRSMQQKTWPLWIFLIGIAVERRHSLARELEAVHITAAGTNAPVHFVALWLFLFWNNTRLLPFHAGFDSRSISNTSTTSRNIGRFRCRLKAWKCISRRSII